MQEVFLIIRSIFRKKKDVTKGDDVFYICSDNNPILKFVTRPDGETELW